MHDAPHHKMSRHVKRDTKCHALKIRKSPLSNNCSKIGMTMSNIANKKPPGVLHPSVKKWDELIFLRIYGHFNFVIQLIGDKIVETLYSNRVTLENKRIHTAPLSPPFKVGVFFVFYW